MNELKQHALLLSIVALLAAMKFIVVPIIEWQDAIFMEIQQQQKKLSKVGGVVNKKSELTQQNTELTQALAITEKVFFPTQTESSFQLKQQKMLEAMLEQYKLKSTRFGWKQSTELTDLSVKKYQLQVFLNGQTTDMVKLMAALEQYSPYIEVSEFIFTIKQQKEKKLGQVRGNLTLHLYANNI